jgi:hypothetical protein
MVIELGESPMPSPFPGMDPYLENPEIWPDFHNSLAAAIRGELNRVLHPPFYARLESRAELGIAIGPVKGSSRAIADVGVAQRSEDASAQGRAVRPAASVREVSPRVELAIEDERFESYFVEIRDSHDEHRLITLIVILSPSNKRKGPDRKSYAKKQRDIFSSDVNLAEIDLLRAGRRILPNARLTEALEAIVPRPDYVVLTSPHWHQSGARRSYFAYPIRLRDRLPCVGIPLRADVPEAPLDLQRAVDAAYDAGPYLMGALDYSERSTPSLSDSDDAWAKNLLTEQGFRRNPA